MPAIIRAYKMVKLAKGTSVLLCDFLPQTDKMYAHKVCIKEKYHDIWQLFHCQKNACVVIRVKSFILNEK